ncbi:MAG: N-acetyltransferase [Desulfobacteraceae bacterium]|nr:MAG: N-acetyltransferase [Desulfobacteraceae bacterium]
MENNAGEFQTGPKNFDVFLRGETVDLCAPSDDDWVIEQWYRWFNKPDITKYLAQGVYPNTFKLQKTYYDNLINSGSRIALLIKPKKHDHFVGVASLSSIDTARRQCDFAMVIGEKMNDGDSLFYGIESKCLMTEHAFENLGVERINSSQAAELVVWQRWQILFGYQIEGLQRKTRKGGKTYDVLLSSCLLEDYLKIMELRGGKLWPGKKAMFELLKRLPSVTLIDELMAWLPKKQRAYFDSITFHLDVAKNG